MRYALVLFTLFLVAGRLTAQEKTPLVSGNFEGSTFEQFAKAVEAKGYYHFYYAAEQLDTVILHLDVKDQPLEHVLELVFQGTALVYSFDGKGHVFITRGLHIVTGLPEASQDSGKNNRGVTVTYGKGGNADKHGDNTANKLYEIGIKTNAIQRGSAVVVGHIRNSKTGDPISGAAIFSEAPSSAATVTDQYGYFTLNLPKGHHLLSVQGLGMRDSKYQIVLYSDGRLDMDLREQVSTLKEVIVSAQRTANIRQVQMGVEHLTIQSIKQVPTVMGEADILRVVLTLPGVKTVGEASTGFNVRGGATDQNLILFNDATIYNPSHFFGMFAAFNPDVVKDVELYKSSIPAKYGGRLSSVLDITSREGNKRELSGSAGVGLLTSRFMLEGPLIKDKTSFILGARTTYANWLLGLLPDQYKHSKGSFNDFNLGISHMIDNKNSLYFSGYISNDKFNLNNDTTYGYGNRNFSVKWKHAFSNKVNAAFTAGYDRYKYYVSSTGNAVDGFKLAFDINQLNFKSDFTWSAGSKHVIDFGTSTIRYLLHPGTYTPLGKASLVAPDTLQKEQALENAVYLSDRYAINSNLAITGGIRFSVYNDLGPYTQNLYAPGLPVQTFNQTGTKTFGKGSTIKTYGGPEYRLSVRYAFSNSFSIKAGYNSLRQYIHMLSNTTAIAPTDIWKLSDANIKPQLGDQISLGLYKNLHANTIETSVEVYYKRLKDFLDYRSGATLIMNHHIETDVLNSKGKAYGVEFSIKKTTGKLNGWVSYTWSRTFLKTDDPTAGETVNNGKYYPADFDIPNNVTVVGNFKVNHRFSVSLNGVYSTGRPITLPIGQYNYAGSARVLYSDRNAYRIPDYFRTDLSMNIDGNYKVHQLTHNSWTIGVYNLTGRHNPYSVYFVSENGVVNGYKLSIFGSAIPFVNFNIRF
jgi:hypothetical protein